MDHLKESMYISDWKMASLESADLEKLTKREQMNTQAQQVHTDKFSHSPQDDEMIEHDLDIDIIKQGQSRDRDSPEIGSAGSGGGEGYGTESGSTRGNTHSSIDSLVEDEESSEEDEPIVTRGCGATRAEVSPLLNIPPTQTNGNKSSLTSGDEGTTPPPSEGSAEYISRGRRRRRMSAGRDTDSDNNRSRNDTAERNIAERNSREYNVGNNGQSFTRSPLHHAATDSMMYPPSCGYGMDHSQLTRQHNIERQHSASSHYAHTPHVLPSPQNNYCPLNHPPSSFEHFNHHIPHAAHANQSNCCSHHDNQSRSLSQHRTNQSQFNGYPSGSYDPPWDLNYELGHIRPTAKAEHSGYHHVYPTRRDERVPHSIISRHPNQRNSIHGSQPSVPIHSSSSHHLVSAANHQHDMRQDMRQAPVGLPQSQGPSRSATLATTGSHSYEMPWDLPPDRVLAFWQMHQQQSATLQVTDKPSSDGQLVSATLPAPRKDPKRSRHAPPPNAPPPPPPEGALRRPLLHYDTDKLTQFNYNPNLPEKKKGIRCNWKCLAIFTTLALIMLAACVAAFAVLLIRKENSPISASNKGTGILSSPVTDSNIEDRHRSEILPHDLVKVRFNVPTSQFFKFNMTIDETAVIGIYGRQGQQPTHTQFDFFKVISGPELAATRPRNERNKRSTDSVQLSDVFTQYLEAGYWYMSLYNDGAERQNVRFVASRHDIMDTGCPSDCHGRGDCREGLCQCYDGYIGVDCRLKQCPVLCEGNGVYALGVCRCFDGWKGPDCSVEAHHCEECRNGRCDELGVCVCDDGWGGETCDQVSCPEPSCTGHGICSEGRCYCETGYRGAQCHINEAVNFTIACSNDCSSHGTFDTVLQACSCEPGWQGKDCQYRECSVPCINGMCVDGSCSCEQGWEGTMCTEKRCDSRCTLHGQCNNGTCTCNPGYNGKHCTLVGCENRCNNQGECSYADGLYACQCSDGYTGDMCEFSRELDCSDGQDNDSDGLSDCSDPDCCDTRGCMSDPNCLVLKSPVDLLMTIRSSSQQSNSFYNNYKFLLEKHGGSVELQRGASELEPIRVSIIRGRVLLRDGSPALGTRVDILDQPFMGFTVTQADGRFDILVNGGGSVVVNALKSDMRAQAPVTLAWNTIATVDDIILTQETVEEPHCDFNHDRLTVYPQVLPSWQHNQLGVSPISSIIPESQELMESHKITGTDIRLVYRSSKARGYSSFLLLRLTQNSVPSELSRVYLRISVEGVVFEKVFEAEANLTYKHAWDRRNAYKQNVYGIVPARVSVGYGYEGCTKVYWHVEQTTVNGHVRDEKHIAYGWNFDIYHRYNIQKGILHLGDGTNIHLKEQPPNIHSLLDNQTATQLLNIQSMATDFYGYIFVADANLVKSISPDRKFVVTVAQLSSGFTNYRLATSPLDASVYISNADSYQIMKIKEPRPDTDRSTISPSDNVEVVAGTGERCSDGGGKCENDINAKLARLSSPRGITVHPNGDIYFIDDTTVRVVSHGIISTLIGNGDLLTTTMPCHQAVDLSQASPLVTPYDLALNPVDGTLVVADRDTNLVLKVTPEGQVVIVAGRSSSCSPAADSRVNFTPGSLGSQAEKATNVKLTKPILVTFSPRGELYITEQGADRNPDTVRVVTPDGYISHYAGRVLRRGATEIDDGDIAATSTNEAILSKISSTAMSPDGILYIAESTAKKIYNITTLLPQPRQHRYWITSPDQKEEYLFDQLGYLLETIDKLTGNVLYNFTIWPPVSGKLQTISSAFSNTKLEILRDPRRGTATGIRVYETGSTLHRNITGAALDVTEDGKLLSYTDLYGQTTEYDYELSTGLITSKRIGRGENYLYKYDENGRIIRLVTPTGTDLVLRDSVDQTGARIEVVRENHVVITATYYRQSLELKSEGQTNATRFTYSPDGSVVVNYGNTGAMVSLTSPASHLTAEGYTVQRRVVTSKAAPSAHTHEWRYYIQKLDKSRFARNAVTLNSKPNRKELLVNGVKALKFQYVRMPYDSQLNEWTGLETILNADSELDLIKSIHTLDGKPIKIRLLPNSNTAGSAEFEYTETGLLQSYTHGNISMVVQYTPESQVSTVAVSSPSNRPRHVTRYTYTTSASQTLPTSIYLPNGVQYSLEYDDLGNLKSLTTPSASKHRFYRLVSLGTVRFMYEFVEASTGQQAANTRQFIMDKDENLRPTRIIYPSLQRRVYARYAVSGRLTEILYDTQSLTYNYNAEPNRESVLLKHDSYSCELVSRYNGSLIEQTSVTLRNTKQTSSTLNAANVVIDYEYDSLMQPSQVSGILSHPSQTSRFSLTFKRSNLTGHLTQVSNFQISSQLAASRRISRRVVLNDGQATITRQYNDEMLLSRVELKFGSNSLVYNSDIEYSSHRVVLWSADIGTYKQSVSYGYNSVSQISQVQVNGGRLHEYRYNAQGSLSEIQASGQSLSIQLDSMERVKQFKGENYQFDADGFIQSKSDIQYTFNSRGQLTSVLNSGVFDVTYVYDPLGRLLIRRNNYGETTLQFVYAMPIQPHDKISYSPTHIYKASNRALLSYIRDDEDTLIAVDIGGQRYYTMTDPSGTPVGVYTTKGQMIKRVDYTVFGEVIQDTKPDFVLHVGFHGSFYDEVTKLVFLDGRWYDPQLGRYLESNLAAIFDTMEGLVSNPVTINGYQLQEPIKSHVPSLHDVLNTDAGRWLKKLGYDLDSLIPDVTQSLTPDEGHPLVPIVSGYQSTYLRDMGRLHDVAIVPRSQFLSTTHPLSNIRSASSVGTLNPGITLERRDDQVIAHLFPELSPMDELVFTQVLNGSYNTGLNFTVSGRLTYYLIKVGLGELSADMMAVGLQNGPLYTESRLQVVRSGSRLKLSAERILISIWYSEGRGVGESIRTEREHVLNSQFDAAEGLAWRQEQQIIQNGRRSDYHWTNANIDEIRNKGYVTGYRAKPIKSLQYYPELSPDPNNVHLISS